EKIERRSAFHETVVPNSLPTPAVRAMAAAPQNATRAAPVHADAPPARAARAPNPARQASETAATKRLVCAGGTSIAVRIGNVAPTANVPADANAACSGRAARLSE